MGLFTDRDQESLRVQTSRTAAVAVGGAAHGAETGQGRVIYSERAFRRGGPVTSERSSGLLSSQSPHQCTRTSRSLLLPPGPHLP